MPVALRRLALLVLAAILPMAVVAPPAGADRLRYVALGDSYSSGVGAEKNPPEPCHRSEHAYAPRFARSGAGSRYDLVFEACAGASTKHVITEGQSAAGIDEPQINRVKELAGSVELVTITIGGNDARFAEILNACVKGPRSCVYYYGPGGERGDQSEWTEYVVRPALVETYRKLTRAAPQDRVLVLTYPHIFQEQRECGRDVGINAGEKRWLREQTTRLNDVIRQEAPRFDLEVVDVEEAFAGHEICTADPYAAGIGQPGVFHPKAKGYEVLTNHVVDAVT